MINRRARLWLYVAALVVDLSFLTSSITGGSRLGIVVWSVFAVLQTVGLVRTVRNRPWPELSVDRLRVMRRQALALTAGAASLAVLLVLIALPAERAGAVVVAVFLGALAAMGLWLAHKLSESLADGEIPPELEKYYEERERRRQL